MSTEFDIIDFENDPTCQIDRLLTQEVANEPGFARTFVPKCIESR